MYLGVMHEIVFHDLKFSHRIQNDNCEWGVTSHNTNDYHENPKTYVYDIVSYIDVGCQIYYKTDRLEQNNDSVSNIFRPFCLDCKLNVILCLFCNAISSK